MRKVADLVFCPLELMLSTTIYSSYEPENKWPKVGVMFLPEMNGVILFLIYQLFSTANSTQICSSHMRCWLACSRMAPIILSYLHGRRKRADILYYQYWYHLYLQLNHKFSYLQWQFKPHHQLNCPDFKCNQPNSFNMPEPRLFLRSIFKVMKALLKVSVAPYSVGRIT